MLQPGARQSELRTKTLLGPRAFPPRQKPVPRTPSSPPPPPAPISCLERLTGNEGRDRNEAPSPEPTTPGTSTDG